VARSRNQPRRQAAWLLLVILLVLIALVARIDAAPGGASVFDEEGDEETEDRAAERAEIDDSEDDDGEGDDELRTLVGERGDDAGAPADLAVEDAGTPASLALGDDGEAGWSAGAGALAMLDAELAPGDATAGLDAANAGATAGAQEAYEQWMRHQRPSRWGRLDVGMSWRHRRSEPIHTPAYSHDEIWLVATWRR
jgi:hypothetical protein